jgi:hypothetical protein
VNQRAFEDIGVAALIRAADPTGIVEMREGTFDPPPLWCIRWQVRAPRIRRRLAYTGLLDTIDFGRFLEGLRARFYAPVMGWPSLAPGRYFRLLVGYFEGIDSERGIARRASDSLAIRSFLQLPVVHGDGDWAGWARVDVGATAELPKSPGHPFYSRLNALLNAIDSGDPSYFTDFHHGLLGTGC